MDSPIPKKVVIVVHHYPPHISGIGSVAHSQAVRLTELGHKVTVITSRTNDDEKSTVMDGVDVIRVKAWNFSEDWSAPFPIFSFRLFSVLRRHIKSAEIVHIHDAFYMCSFLAGVFARLYRKPIVLTQHVSLVAHPSQIVLTIEKLVYATSGRLLFRWSKIILTYNNRVMQFLKLKGIPEKKLETMVNGVDTENFKPATYEEKRRLKEELGLTQTKKIVLFVGRFVPKKRFDLVLAAKSEKYQLVFAGGDALGPNSDEIVFLGKVSAEKMHEIYQIADIFVLPSESEGFPLSIQEAMASGLAIITANDEGYDDYKLDTNLFYLINNPTKDSVKAAIENLVDDNEKISEMSEYSRKYALENFRWPLVISRLNSIYEEVVVKQAKRLKIAMVSDAVYPYNKGGKEKRLYDISTRLAKEGFDVTIYCMKWWEGEKIIIKDGVTYHAISPYYPLYAGTRRSISQAVLFSLHSLKLIKEDFDVVDVDHIPHFAIYATKLVAVLRRKKMIVTWHEVWGKKYWQNYLGSIMGSMAYIVELVSMKLPTGVISVSEHTTKRFVDLMPNTKKEIITIPNGLDMKYIKESSMSEESSDVIFAGRLLGNKNIDILLHAIAEIKKTEPRISLVVIGEGPEKKNLEKLQKELKLETNVSFLGFFEDQRELYSIMKASKVFVLPSTREGFGIAVIEANACGLPVITIDHEENAAKNLIEEGENGMVVTLDATKIADAILKTIAARKDAAYYEGYSEKYNWENLMPRITNTYNKFS